MSTHTPKDPRVRSWYHVGELVDEYRENAKGNDGELKMLKTFKIIRSIFVVVAMSAIALYALYLGADPTLVAVISVPALAAIVSEAIDYAALVQGYIEARDSNTDSEE